MASAEFVRVDRYDHRSLVVTGDVDALAQTRFRKFLQDALAEPPQTMHLDLTEVSYFEASSIEVLAHFVKVAMGTPMTLRLAAASTVRTACREHADAEWLLSTFDPFVAAAARRTPMLLLPTVADQLARRDTADYPVLVVVGEVDLATAKDFAAAAIALLNTATVAGGACVGLALGKWIPQDFMSVALHGLGLVTVGMSIKMFFQAKNLLIVAIAIALGGLLGAAIGIHHGIEVLADWAKLQVGGSTSLFSQGIVTSFVLFCIGPMTLLGCVQDAIEKKIDILALKSTMDGIAAIFFAAATGAGILVTALLLIVSAHWTIFDSFSYIACIC